MTSLARDLRKDLEKTVKLARRVAEAGARKAVEQLGVGEGDAPKHLTPDQRGLRNRLRAHARQLGDRRDAKAGTQATSRLMQECAYEHWHRMLFARFLAETDLLIEPDTGVAVTLDEVQELAREKSTDWLELASDYAERMLPQIFRKGDPVLDIPLPPETRSELEDLLKKLPRDVFQADDSLGWVYQFWQAERKDEVNKSETKIGADELPAVTQLFTEDYMVLFLLHNTFGAWWAGKILAARPELAASAKSEGELRAACTVGEIKWNYLRFVRDKAEDGAEGPWRPAAGTFEGWPKAAKDVSILDPCMGSGHFLVFALPILVAFRMAEENLSREAAIDAVLRDNLFGLEIDPRCTQIAAFNLAFAAWRMIGFRPLPRLNLACSGLAIGVTKSEWLKLAERAAGLADPAAKRDIFGLEKNLITSGISERARNGLERLYDLFAKAPWLGSLIDPRRAGGDIFSADFAQLEPLLAPILSVANGDEVAEMVVAAQGMAKAAEMLGRSFSLVATNVPYLGRGKQDSHIREFIETYYPKEKSDLSTCFISRCLKYCSSGGAIAVVSPRNWWFLAGYTKFRETFLTSSALELAATLGEEAWETFGDRGPNTVMICASRADPGQSHKISFVNASPIKTRPEKIVELQNGDVSIASQSAQKFNQGHVITLTEEVRHKPLGAYGRAWQGLVTGDDAKFVLKFWETSPISRKLWEFYQGPPKRIQAHTGRENLIRYEGGEGSLHNDSNAHNFPPKQVLGRLGIAIQQMRYLNVTKYTGEIFSPTVTPFVPNDDKYIPAIWAYMTSSEFHRDVRKFNSKVNVTNGTFALLPFDYETWNQVARERFLQGVTFTEPDDPTQWLFNGKPQCVDDPLQVATVRLTGYRWPRQWGSSFVDYPAIGTDDIERHSDQDGIVCLTATKGEAPAHERLSELLRGAFGADWSAARLASLLDKVGFAGKTLDDWLRDGFFQQHCDLFQQRPFVWHVWDGRRDGFHALINCHRLTAPGGEGRRTLEKLIYSYLGDWIDRQRADQKAGFEGADGRLAAAERLRAELSKILEGEPPYDIFVRWKALHEQPIGWEPDINDGVRINIRPFMTARPLNAYSPNTCILRTTPKIKWDKDRGKEPTREKADYPWFWCWDEAAQDFTGAKDFDGNRWNDLHYSRAVKQAARDRHLLKSGGRK
jgi:hypothetical protein